MAAVSTIPPLLIVGLASPVYWPDAQELQRFFTTLSARLSEHATGTVSFHLLHGEATEEDLAAFREATAVLVPMSGGVQPLLLQIAPFFRHQALANAYLPEFLAGEAGHALMHRNAHPACTDYFAHSRRSEHAAVWLGSMEDFASYSRAHAAVTALEGARILRIGETEPWVINSTRAPERFREALGCEVIPLEAEELYEEFRRIPEDDAEAAAMANDWWTGAGGHEETTPADAQKAARVATAMRRLLNKYDADALAMACFAMIGALDTTSCLALSSLNDSAHTIGACEGDLDAAVTLFLLKHLGADFVWIANPIIHPEDFVDLAHCTAPRCACGAPLPYRLLRHHESGRGIAPEVELPADREVTLARIGANLTELCIHSGLTEGVKKQPTCHTQIRVRIPSSRRFLETLNGTHVVMSYGDWSRELAFCAELLGLKMTGAEREPPSTEKAVLKNQLLRQKRNIRKPKARPDSAIVPGSGTA